MVDQVTFLLRYYQYNHVKFYSQYIGSHACIGTPNINRSGIKCLARLPYTVDLAAFPLDSQRRYCQFNFPDALHSVYKAQSI